eukprot:TRINITY_DN76151_c0_g1_i1.p1 TRINITY_DN76151_c0_g1~~TRINITY_DN76151_c0_g1_i1.p1  ORF type:complete len:196 (+),score=40.53 TRINITY_DN76151_c0_g1_i1:79-666(+)
MQQGARKVARLDVSRGLAVFGSEQLYKAVLQEYADAVLPAALQQVRDARQQDDVDALREVSLKIQASASYLGAERLYAAASDLVVAVERSESASVGDVKSSQKVLEEESRFLLKEVACCGPALSAAGSAVSGAASSQSAAHAASILPRLPGAVPEENAGLLETGGAGAVRNSSSGRSNADRPADSSSKRCKCTLQ